MKSTGIVRRIVIPKELRRTLKIEDGDPVEIFTEGSKIVLKPYRPGCEFCNGMDDLQDVEGIHICRKCAEKLVRGLK